MSDGHRNDERMVECPVCGDEVLARGINLHVRQTDGQGHGPTGEIPDHVDFDNLNTVGKREVAMDYPAERESDEVARLCPYCATAFQGTNGIMIHLGQVAGRNNHPENPQLKHDADDFPRVEVDDRGNVTDIDRPEFDTTLDEDGPSIPAARVYRYIANLLSEDKQAVAARARRELLTLHSDEDPEESLSFVQTILQQSIGGGPHPGLVAARQGDAVSVETMSETKRLPPEAARDLASKIERELGDDSPEHLENLVQWLRDSADVLYGTRDPEEVPPRYIAGQM